MEGDTAVYADALQATTIAAQASAEGGVRALVVVADATAPAEFRFPIAAPAGSHLELQADGSVDLVGAGGKPIGHFETPWARDATGLPVDTRYRVEGSTLVLTIGPAASFPVVADPQFTWGWVTGTVYFTRGETYRMQTVSGAVSLVGWLCVAVITSVVWSPLCVGAAAFGGVWAEASYAYGRGNCLKIKVPTLQPGEVRRGTRNCS